MVLIPEVGLIPETAVRPRSLWQVQQLCMLL